MMHSLSFMKALWPFFPTAVLASSIVFNHGTIITYNETMQDIEVMRNASVLIVNDRVTQLANETTIKSLPKGTRVVDATGMIISPGVINTHHHLWQTAFKTLGSNCSLTQYFQRYGEFGPAEKQLNGDDTYLGQLMGSLELMHEGTTTVLDHSHADWSDASATGALNGTIDSGLRTYYAHAIHELPNGYSVEKQLALYDTWMAKPYVRNASRVKLGMACDLFSSLPAKNVSALWGVVQKHNLSVITSHYIGGPYSYANSPELLDGYGWLNHSVPYIFSHASFITQADFRALRKNNQYISTTSESEAHYGHAHPYSHLIQDQATLGVDTHFTFSSGMLGQARQWMQNARIDAAENFLLNTFDLPANDYMSVHQAYHLITRAGALALRNKDIGVIRKGSKADIVVIDGTSPNMLGWWDPVAALILHSNTGDIKHVLIDGQFMKKDGKLTHPNYSDLQAKFLKSATKIQNYWLNHKWPAVAGTQWVGSNDPNFTEIVEIPVMDAQAGPGNRYDGY